MVHFTLWVLNIAMGNDGLFSSMVYLLIAWWFSMAMLNNQMVYSFYLFFHPYINYQIVI